jgi:PAS domain S-box-containing protein
MILVDSTGQIVMVNSQTSVMFGYEPADLVGRSIEVLVPARYRRRHRVYRESFLSRPTRRAMNGNGGQRADGTEFTVEIGLTPIDDHGNGLVMATVIDMSERLRAKQEITRQHESLTRLNQQLSQFAYSASHDLKAPLVTLDGLLLCIQEDIEGGDQDTAVINVAKARDRAQRMAQMIEGILDVARSENHEDRVELITLAAVVDEVGSQLVSSFTGNEVELRNEVAPDLTLHSDPVRLTQMLTQLIDNGAKYADPTRSERFVTVSAAVENEETVIEVRDNGIGIPVEDHGLVFAMFGRSKNHDVSGSGLGLALARHHVSRLDGSLDFESDGEGTTLTIRLPVESSALATAGGNEVNR